MIPFSAGIAYKIKSGLITFTLELTGEVVYVKATDRFLGNEAAQIPEFEQRWDDTVFGLNGALGGEWNLVTKFVLGFRAGYRQSEAAELTLAGDTEPGIAFDLSGAYVSVFFAVMPWAAR